MITGPEQIHHILEAIGCLGSWEVDWKAERLRQTGRLASAYGLTAAQASDGIDLCRADRVYHPDDIDEVRRVRKTSLSTKGGNRVMRFRIVDADGQTRWIESHGHILVDRYGALTQAYGIAFDRTALVQAGALSEASPPSLAGLDNLSAELLQTYRSARTLGLTDVAADLKPILTRVVRLLGTRFRHTAFH